MREKVLRDFFLGKVSAADLSKDIEGSRRRVRDTAWVVDIEDMETRFEITRSMLIVLCDAVLAARLPAPHLKTIGFALQASDNFGWDDELVSDVTSHWSSPEINYPLTLENVERFKGWLLGTEAYPERATSAGSESGRLYEVVHKNFVKPWWKKLLVRHSKAMDQ